MSRQLLVLGIWLSLTTPAGLAQQDIQLGRFPDVSTIETTLKRGVSTRAEILDLLGEPSGPGTFQLPVQLAADGQTAAHAGGEVLFYQDLVVEDMRNVDKTIWMDMKQRILLVFVKEGKFDGFMWYANEGGAQAR